MLPNLTFHKRVGNEHFRVKSETIVRYDTRTMNDVKRKITLNKISCGTNYILLIVFLYNILKKLYRIFENNSATYFQYTKNVP